MTQKECTRCLFTEDIATIMPDGECEYCKLHDKLEAKAQDFTPVLWKIKQAGKGKQYDCVIGISGGVDSSTLLYAAVTRWKLRPLVIHFDNGYNKMEAELNMRNLCEETNTNYIRYINHNTIYRSLNATLRHLVLPDADIPNDIAMTKLIYEAARMYKIKYILNGHDFRTEGSSPKKWSLIDSKYLRSVGEFWTPKNDFDSFPFFTIKDQLYYAFLGIKQVRPFHYKNSNRTQEEIEMRERIGFKEYGGKHAENLYTEWVGKYYLPNFHNIDKRITYLSAQVRSGTISKQEAKETLLQPIDYDGSNQWDVGYTKMDRSHFPRYNFKKYRAFWWVLMKAKVVPYTFYAKYCK